MVDITSGLIGIGGSLTITGAGAVSGGDGGESFGGIKYIDQN